ncbi:MAG TPA: hypothetical protein VFM18_05875 [Methanosarcina sp.]|nr:hypothetical protein [Methanosarcina sp.]
MHDHEKEFKEKMLKNRQAERFLAIQSNNLERLYVLDVQIKAIREMIEEKYGKSR